MKWFLISIVGLTMLANTSLGSPSTEVTKILDQLHTAASKADGKTYFDLFAPNGVFIGTDATERWTVAEFKAYANPYFAKGQGWTYKPTKRSIDLDPSGTVAWFDEILENESYGTCRGSGVLYKIDGQWRIAQYHLTIPIPNPLAKTVAQMIRKKS